MKSIAFYILLNYFSILCETSEYIVQQFYLEENLKIEDIYFIQEENRFKLECTPNFYLLKTEEIPQSDKNVLIVKANIESISQIKFNFIEEQSNTRGSFSFDLNKYRIKYETAVLVLKKMKS